MGKTCQEIYQPAAAAEARFAAKMKEAASALPTSLVPAAARAEGSAPAAVVEQVPQAGQGGIVTNEQIHVEYMH